MLDKLAQQAIEAGKYLRTYTETDVAQLTHDEFTEYLLGAVDAWHDAFGINPDLDLQYTLCHEEMAELDEALAAAETRPDIEHIANLLKECADLAFVIAGLPLAAGDTPFDDTAAEFFNLADEAPTRVFNFVERQGFDLVVFSECMSATVTHVWNFAADGGATTTVEAEFGMGENGNNAGNAKPKKKSKAAQDGEYVSVLDR